MKYLLFLAAPVLMFTWLACGNESPADKTGTSETAPVVTPANSTEQPQTVPVNVDAGKTSTTTTNQPVTIPTTTTIPAGNAVAGLNPAHGQPNHRCDIPVGAPLNSKPAQQPAITTTTPASIPANQVVQPGATVVAPGMNPAHGQPGHRCDIEVGAPLNSKPIQTTVVPQSTNDSQATPLVTPVKPLPDTSRQK